MSIISIMLLLSGVVWLVREVPFIQALSRPNLFVGVAATVGLLLAGVIIFLLFRLQIVYSITRTLLFLLVVSLSLQLFCLTSFLNRNTGYQLMTTQTRAQTSGR
ncbi:hypothetical protein EFA69_11945 [Rufibacter immobilis]|uniref:Uncharacterized protein n=1 Tax=Rufibacter immobilis TaxID=1348778 RepID=A0A3M9MXE1_9BACT|nr:hypothetical protein [Rufibacter immobilis]RNI30204.1 hypothetical protein EFA69_11945 [Rufibacter immobilis]